MPCRLGGRSPRAGLAPLYRLLWRARRLDISGSTFRPAPAAQGSAEQADQERQKGPSGQARKVVDPLPGEIAGIGCLSHLNIRPIRSELVGGHG